MAKIITSLSNSLGAIHNNLEGLNEGDYIHLTQIEKNKFDAIENGAEINVNADWNSISGDSEILNKPTEFIPISHNHSVLDVSGTKIEFNNSLTDGNFLFQGDLIPFEPLNYDLVNFTNTSVDPFVKVSEIPTPQDISGKENLSNKQNSLTPDGTGIKYPTVDAIRIHTTDLNNPHSVNKTQIGLSNVNNTSDIDKPISTLTQTALNLKQNLLTNPITGSLTNNTIPKATGTNTLGNSNITDSGTLVSTSTDMTINGVRAGRGGGNLSTNLAFGTDALRDNLTGTGNTAIGSTALRNSLNSNNLAIGAFASQNGTVSNNNISIGNFSLLNNTAGTNNTAIGLSAGRFISDLATNLTNVNNGLFIGNLTSPLANNSTNEIVIATNGKGLGNNTTAIGNSSTLSARIWGRFLSGTSVDDGVNQGQFSGTVTASPATLSNQVVVKSQVDLKADIASPTFTGVPSVPTATAGTNTTQIASTAFVSSALNSGNYQISVNRTESNLIEHRIFNNSSTTVSLENNYLTGIFRQAVNFSSGTHNRLRNESTGIGNRNINLSSGIFNSNLNEVNTGIFNDDSNTGSGIFNKNTNSGIGVFNDSYNISTGFFDKRRNDSTGILNYYDSNAGSTGDLQQYLKAGVVTAKINHLGEITAPKITMTGTIELKSYTVATLPTGVEGATAYVTDAIAPIYLGALTGGGTVKCPVFYNGTIWVSH